MNLKSRMSLSFLTLLWIACPNPDDAPLEESPNSTFQEVETSADVDAGENVEITPPVTMDAGEAPPAVQGIDAGVEDNIIPPVRDSGVSGRRCTVSDLIYTAEPRDANGACTDACASNTIEFVGKVFNPCDHVIEFTTNSSCIVNQWEWKKHDQATAQSERMSPMCGQAITTHRLDAESFKEQSSGQVTGFSSGNWILTITFSSFSSGNAISVSPAGEEVSVTFSSL